MGATESDAPVEAASPRPSLPRTPPRPPAESTDHVKVKQPKSLWVVWSSLSWGEKLGYAALALPALPLALVLGPVMCLHLQLESQNASYYASGACAPGERGCPRKETRCLSHGGALV